MCNGQSRLAGALATLLCLTSARAGDEAHFALAVVDAETKRPLASARGYLVDPALGREYASFDGLRYTGERAPVAGDKLYVYAHGYDLALRSLPEDWKPGSTFEFFLPPAREACEIVIEGEDAATVRYSLEFYIFVPLTRPEKLTLEADSHEGCLGKVPFTIPRGTSPLVIARSEAGVLSPPSFYCRPGATHVLHLDRDRIVPVRINPPPQGLDPGMFEILPDFLWTPRASPVQIDAWRLAMNRPSWLFDGLRERPPVLRVRPPVPLHLFGSIGGEGFYRYLPLDAELLDLRGPHARKRIVGRPRGAGLPLPEGTCLAPGRLDAYGITALLTLHRDLKGCCLLLGPPGEEWRERFLPAAEVLTAWHSSLGLIHMEWTEAETPSGVPCPGVAEVSLTPGLSARGYVSVYPVWKGAGEVRTSPPDTPLRKKFGPGITQLRFPGLTLGMHSMEIQVELADRSGAAVLERNGAREFEFTEAAPVHRVVLGQG